LKEALEFPYCHHEKWDDSEYPQGLKGDEIPLSARIFAIVDVWDALRSDRPYREALPNEKVIDYITAESGKHFDPRVVDTFLSLIHSSGYHR
jgi:response regulator RpfG family c-di-GMP phosphodiesterase